MSYQLVNKPSTELKNLNLTDEMKSFCEAIRQGETEIIPNWETIETLFEIFPDNEDWEISRLSNGMYAILPKSKLMKKRQETIQRQFYTDLQKQ